MRSRRPRFLALMAASLIVAVLGSYVIYVRAAGSEGLARGFLGLPWPFRAEVQLTATPTKTPAAIVSPTPTRTSLRQLPTLTPAATPTTGLGRVEERQRAAVSPTPSSTPLPPLSAELVQLAEQRGIDPSGRFVVVDQNQQQMYVVQDGTQVRALPISSGNPDDYFLTPAWSGMIGEYWGSFNAGGVWADDAWYLFELSGGGTILIHSAPYVLQAGVKVYQELDALGLYPASRGCIRLRPEDARWFTEWQPQGVPIIITPWNGGTAQQG